MAKRKTGRRIDLLETWQYLLETHALLERQLGAAVAERFDLTMSSVEVLMRLLNSEGRQRPSTQLARQVSFSSGGLTKLIDRLAGRGLVERRGEPGDRRVVMVCLTPEGIEVARDCAHVLMDQLEQALVPAWRPDLLDTVRTALLGLRDTLGDTKQDGTSRADVPASATRASRRTSRVA